MSKTVIAWREEAMLQVARHKEAQQGGKAGRMRQGNFE